MNGLFASIIDANASAIRSTRASSADTGPPAGAGASWPIARSANSGSESGSGQEGVGHPGSNQRPRRTRTISRAASTAVLGDEHVGGLRQAGDAGEDRDRVAAQLVGLAAAVPVLVQIPHRVGGGIGELQHRHDVGAALTARLDHQAALAGHVAQRGQHPPRAHERRVAAAGLAHREPDRLARAGDSIVALIAFLLLRLAQATQTIIQSPIVFSRLMHANLMHRR